MTSQSTTNPVLHAAGNGVLALGALATAWLAVHRTTPAVRNWRPGAGSMRPASPLAARVHGEGPSVIVLLSGLASSGLVWGSQFDALGEKASVVALDPLGFGRSKDATWGPGSIEEAHADAIEATLESLGLAGRPTIAVGHSFGANLALRWAARSPDVRGVVALSAPLFLTREEADKRIAQMGWMESLLASGSTAKRLCRWMCAHPNTASLAAVALSPRLPAAIAAASIQHSWSTYMSNFDGIVRDAGWRSALAELHEKEIPVTFLYGRSDAVRVPGRIEGIVRGSSEVHLRLVSGGHQLPLIDALACVDEIDGMLRTVTDHLS